MAPEEKSARDIELEAKNAEADAINKTRSGVGTRVHVGQTRGKNPIVISWEAFDDSAPDTHPKSFQEFSEITKTDDPAKLLEYMIDGYNTAQYVAASDPLAEYVEVTWPDEAKLQFRLVVRNYARGAKVETEDAVKLIKPGFVAQFGPAPAVPTPAAN